MSNTFIIAIDPTHHSHGALAFAAWLRATAPTASIQGLHLIATRSGPDDAHQEYVERAVTAIQRLVAAFGVERVLDQVDLLEVPDVVDGLARTVVGARALVVGRRARSGQRALVHLGPVTRKLLRSLPAPVIVVPPELAPPTGARGPVILATDLQDHSADATAFAVAFARDHRCALVVAHVGEVHFGDFIDEVDADWSARRERDRGELQARLETWTYTHGLADHRAVALLGAPVEALLELAEHEQPALMVLGSRRLTLLERVFTTSTASTLAAYAPCPVAIVPPAHPLQPLEPVAADDRERSPA